MNSLTFITGNQGKADNLKRQLGFDILHKKVDLDEIQSASLVEIVEHKVLQAYELLHTPVLVDDVAMGFDDCNGLPGPFIKFFVDSDNGLENICRLCDGLPTRRATAYATMGYYDGSLLKIFTGKITGVIADHPRGNNSYAFGWDVVFCPDGYGSRTRAELNEEDYGEVYSKIRPVAEMCEFLTNKS